MIFLAGFGYWKPGGTCVQGHLGKGLTVEEGDAAARLCGVNLLAILHADFGTLDGVERIVKVLGVVASPPDFTGHSSVIEGCTDLFVDLFGDEGRPARSAIGVASLPGGSAVENACLTHRSHLSPHGRDKRGLSAVRSKIGKRTSAT
jgi:enamine deaminase RidA (YjgF/YER057c/UK114 family)